MPQPLPRREPIRGPRPMPRTLCRFRILFLLAALATRVPAAGGADAWPVPRGPSREPVPYQYDASRWKEVPKDFLEDAPACILYSGTSHLVEANGTVETITHEVTRFNGRKGIEKLGEYH